MHPIPLFIFILHLCPPANDGLVYTAMTRLEDLSLIEKTLVQSLDEFITAEKERLERVTKIAEQAKKAFAKRSSNDTNLISTNPLDVYSLLKRFVHQWSQLESYLENNKSKDLLHKLEIYKPYFPTMEGDLYGSIAAIFLLQDTYNISAKRMASGQIPESDVKVEVHADDCFELGSFALYFGRYHRSRGWLNEALERAQRPNYNGNLDLPILLEHVSWAEYAVYENQSATFGFNHATVLFKY